jgi:hypothetical protein
MAGGSERIDEEAPVFSVAMRMPANLAQAVQAYMTMRKEQIMRKIESCSSFELDGIRHSVAGLVEIMEALQVEPAEKVTDLKRTTRKKKASKGQEKESRASYLAHLYSVLTPPGWENNFLPKIDNYVGLCRLRILEDKEAAVARAGIEESMRFRRFLANTANTGAESAAVMDLRRRKHG